MSTDPCLLTVGKLQTYSKRQARSFRQTFDHQNTHSLSQIGQSHERISLPVANRAADPIRLMGLPPPHPRLAMGLRGQYEIISPRCLPFSFPVWSFLTLAVPLLWLGMVFKSISSKCCCLVSRKASQKSKKALGPLLGSKFRNSTFWLKLPSLAWVREEKIKNTQQNEKHTIIPYATLTSCS